MLQTRGVGLPLVDLARDLEVDERTIQRDIALLQELGFPIDYDEDDYNKRLWKLPHNFFSTGPLVLGLTEALSLHLAEDLLAPLAGTLFHDGLTHVIEKVRSLLPASALDYFRDLDDMVHVRRGPTTDYRRHAGTIRTLADAAARQRSVELSYRSLWRADAYQTRFDPYGLVYFEGDLFAVGRSHKALAIRVLKLTRIDAAALTADRFDRPADFNVQRYFCDSFGIVRSGGEASEVTVRFSGPAATLVEERLWHESQRLEWQPAGETLFSETADDPGALLATFRLADFVEFKRWLRGFGEQAEVLRPDWLRKQMRDEYLAAAERHGLNRREVAED